DHHRPGVNETPGVGARAVATGGEESDVDARGVGPGEVLDDDGAPGGVDRGPGRPGRRKETETVGGEAALLEDVEHGATGGSGRSDAGDGAAHDAPFWRANSWCREASGPSIRWGLH